MTIPDLTYEEVKQVIGTLPSLAPRPNFTNIRALWIDLVDKLTSIPSQQNAALGYAGMVQPTDIYALDTNEPWKDWGNPGDIFKINAEWDEEKKEQEEIY